MSINHTVLYTKGWYKKTDLVEDLKKTLNADGYIPDTTGDVISILLREIIPSIKNRSTEDIVRDVIDSADPHKWWRWHIDNEEYNYHKAIIISLLSLVSNMTKIELGWDDNIKPDYNVLPKSEN